MTWPTQLVTYNNLTSDSSSPTEARSELADGMNKLNQIRTHVSTIAQNFLSRTSQNSVRNDIGFTTLSDPARIPVLLYKQLGLLQVTSLGAETVILSTTIPAGTLTDSSRLVITCHGTIIASLGSTRQYITLTKFGGVTLSHTTGGLVTLLSGDMIYRYESHITMAGSPANTFLSGGIFSNTISVVMSQSIRQSPRFQFGFTSVVSTFVDVSTSQPLVVTITSSEAINIFKLYAATVELI